MITKSNKRHVSHEYRDDQNRITFDDAMVLARDHDVADRRNFISVLMHNPPEKANFVIKSLRQTCPHWFY